MNLKVNIYNNKGEKKDALNLPEAIFSVGWNSNLVHQVVVSMQSNRRSAIAHTKNRGDVRGGGAKPWRQKGTGRARHGSIRSPIWVGGGVTFGPRNERNFKKKINKKMMLKALFSTLSRKNKEGEVLFIDFFEIEKPSVKEAKRFIKAIEESIGVQILAKKKNSAVIFLPEKKIEILKSFNNFNNIKVEETRNLNLLHLLENKYIIFIDPEKTIDFLESKNKSGKNEDFTNTKDRNKGDAEVEKTEKKAKVEEKKVKESANK